MKPEYIHAVESRLQWLRWAKSPIALDTWLKLGTSVHVLRAALSILEVGDCFFMDSHFQELVACAHMEVPDSLVFETKWLLSPFGFMWLDVPFLMPDPASVDGKPVEARALGWRPVVSPETKEECTQVLVFVQLPAGGFGCWSYILLYANHSLSDRIKEFEAELGSGRYRDDQMAGHELRWIYAAFHLMAQKLTAVVPHQTDRATRHRAHRNGQKTPLLINIVTLRRLHLAQRDGDGDAHSGNWQWRWMVTGHWRNQWCPSEATHKPVFIDAYIKGPSDRPMKPTAIRLYVARR